MNFRIVLNPVISITSPDKSKRGVVKPHVTIKHQMDFLVKQSEKNGFSLVGESFSIVERGYEVFRNQKNPYDYQKLFTKEP